MNITNTEEKKSSTYPLSRSAPSSFFKKHRQGQHGTLQTSMQSTLGRASSLLLWPFLMQTDPGDSNPAMPLKKTRVSLKEYARKETIAFTTNDKEELNDRLHDWRNVRVLRMTRDIYSDGDGWRTLPLSLISLNDTLEILDLRGNPLYEVPDSVCKLTNLKELNLENCRITKVPTEIEELACLKKLNLDNNQIGDPQFDSLPSIVYLSLSNNKIQLVSTSLPVNLEVLDLSENSLTVLPDSVFDEVNLKKLYLRQNYLKRLPSSITKLNSLKVLDASKNNLTELPEELGNLSKLCLLNISYNALTALPQSITQLQNIQKDRFLCGENPLQKPPLEVALKGLESIDVYFKALEAGPAFESKRLKVMVLGDAKAGKTSVAKAIVTCKECEDCSHQTTIGIDFFSWKATPLDDNPLEILIVDCAGQKKYLMTHQLFLSLGMLFTVVVDIHSYDMTQECFLSKVAYWIDLIISKVPKAVILIVPTKIDLVTEEEILVQRCEHIIGLSRTYIHERQKHCKEGHQEELKCLIDPVLPKDYIFGGHEPIDNGIQEQDNNIYMIPVSNKNPLVGLSTLCNEIIRIANNQQLCPNVHRTVPESWMKLEKLCMAEREMRPDPIIHMAELQKKATCIQGKNEIIQALEYIDSVGPIVYFNDLASDIVFLDPVWLLQLLKLVFRHDSDEVLVYKDSYQIDYKMFEGDFNQAKRSLTDDALLSKQLLRCIWGKSVSDDSLFELVIKLLQQFNLAFDVELQSRENKMLLMPWYFKDQCPVVIEKPSTELTSYIVTKMEIRGVLPDGFFPRFIIKVYSLNLFLDCKPWNGGFKGLCKDGAGEIICEHRKDNEHSGFIYLQGRTEEENHVYQLWRTMIPILKTLTLFVEDWKGISHKLYSLCPNCFASDVKEADLWHLDIKNLQGSTMERLNCHRDLKVIDEGVIFPPRGILLDLYDEGFEKTGLDESLSVTEKNAISRLLGNNTKSLASALGVHEGTLSPLYYGTNFQERVIEIITKWEQQNKNSEKRHFVNCLKTMLPYPKEVAEVLLTNRYPER